MLCEESHVRATINKTQPTEIGEGRSSRGGSREYLGRIKRDHVQSPDGMRAKQHRDMC